MSQSSGWQWIAANEEPIYLTGMPWFREDKVFRRLPLQSKYPIPQRVDELANCTAGVQARFRTNSPQIAVKVELDTSAEMWHMAAAGEAGFDAYAGDPGEQYYAGTVVFDPRAKAYEGVVAEFSTSEWRTIVINFPLYRGVKKLAIGLTSGSSIEAAPAFESSERIVFYGTSITQGACATRPGMCYFNILTRMFNREFINLGFSGSGKGEPEMAAIIGELPNVGCIVLDYEANCLSTENYRQTLPEFIRIIREHKPLVPLLVTSRIPYGRELRHPTEREERLARLEFQRNLVADLKAKGDQNIHFLSGEELLGSDWHECTVDGVHPTDLGFYRMASVFKTKIQSFLF